MIRYICSNYTSFSVNLYCHNYIVIINSKSKCVLTNKTLVSLEQEKWKKLMSMLGFTTRPQLLIFPIYFLPIL